jgi:nitrogen fixation protein NifU and related proteins
VHRLVNRLSRDQLVERLVEHQRHPRHRGAMANADISVGAGNPGCGDVVSVHVKTTPDGERIEAVSFEGSGCTISQGAASILLQEINRAHPTLVEVRELTLERHLELVGREVVGFRERCAAVGFDALQGALKALDAERRLVAAGYSPEEARRMRLAVEPGR